MYELVRKKVDMGDDRQRGEKDSATRPKQSRGRGRAASKSTESSNKARSRGRGKSLAKDAPLSKANVRPVGQSSERKQSQTTPRQIKDNSIHDKDENAQSQVNLPGETNTRDKTDNKKMVKKRVNGLIAKQNAYRETTVDSGGRYVPSPSDQRTEQTTSGKGKSNKLKHVVESLKMKMKDISNAAEKINNIVKIIIQKVSEKDPLFQDMERMSTGSYYEGVKISKPNEFDIMLRIPITDHQRIGLTEFGKTGAFYTLTCKRKPEDFMERYIGDKGNISSQKIISKFRKLVKKAILGMAVSVMRKKPSSPAVTLTVANKPTDILVDLVLALEIRQRWPDKARGGMNIDDWLGTKVKRNFTFQSFYMVPKQADKEQRAKDTWRISFSHIEKEILINHGRSKTCCESGGEKCCRKQCLKLLKYLLELLGNKGMQRKMNNFCSYHAKTALLLHCTQYPKDEDWKLEDLDTCFNRYIQFFQKCLKNADLPNFFIPSLNLFSLINADCSWLCRELEEQITENYPLFQT
ncbi:cyclic GMP-AMP synthase-like isoform X2 [Mixophyes fleayi]|uniref:cyclic GMP-AMP synthase-like isoform X2 n=1 Tax=Mixophyes fleayi TaxID=3061075 RepID=UPI003F4DA9CD